MEPSTKQALQLYPDLVIMDSHLDVYKRYTEIEYRYSYLMSVLGSYNNF